MKKERVFTVVCVVLFLICTGTGVWIFYDILQQPIPPEEQKEVLATQPSTEPEPAPIQTEPQTQAAEGLRFESPEIEAAVRAYLGKSSGPLLETDLAQITMLDILASDIAVNEKRGGAKISFYYGDMQLSLNGAVFSEAGPITSLEDLRYFSNLEYLRIWYNRVTDISPLSGLTKLTYLSLDGNGVTDITPLRTLKNLAFLDLWKNNVQDISALEGLTELKTLYLFGNRIRDISVLAKLQKLEKVDLDKNAVTDWSPVGHVAQVTGRP